MTEKPEAEASAAGESGEDGLIQARREKAQADYEAAKTDIAWGNQIRSYVLQPYQLVKDLRTEHETGDVQRVLDGEIDDFIEAYLLQNADKATKTPPLS